MARKLSLGDAPAMRRCRTGIHSRTYLPAEATDAVSGRERSPRKDSRPTTPCLRVLAKNATLQEDAFVSVRSTLSLNRGTKPTRPDARDGFLGPVMFHVLAFVTFVPLAFWPSTGSAQMNPQEAFALVVAPVGPQNPRNSEAAIIQRKDGSLLLAWTDYYAGQGADHGPACIAGKVSSDGGRTWGEKYVLVENDGGCNVMEVNFLRLKNGDIALFHLQKNTPTSDCRIMMRTSSDEGKTWSKAKQLSPDGKYTGLTNGRCIRLRTGRILLEAWQGGDSYCCLSDDDGQTWRDSQRVRPEKGPCYEPACVELKDGRVLMLMRTGLGGQFKSLSTDGGETWSAPAP
ncbi:MAG: exo-alpha-sialidase, partial [Planctomycetes bacterium]|nr:exo-alpha-sialidase [Planctomycetota bacterium]